jgi:hypothetical protein
MPMVMRRTLLNVPWIVVPLLALSCGGSPSGPVAPTGGPVTPTASDQLAADIKLVGHSAPAGPVVVATEGAAARGGESVLSVPIQALSFSFRLTSSTRTNAFLSIALWNHETEGRTGICAVGQSDVMALNPGESRTVTIDTIFVYVNRSVNSVDDAVCFTSRAGEPPTFAADTLNVSLEVPTNIPGGHVDVPLEEQDLSLPAITFTVLPRPESSPAIADLSTEVRFAVGTGKDDYLLASCAVSEPDGDALTATWSFTADAGCPDEFACWTETDQAPLRVIDKPVSFSLTRNVLVWEAGRLTFTVTDGRHTAQRATCIDAKGIPKTC